MNLLSQFKDYLFSQDKKASGVTVKNYISDINHFVRWFEKTYAKAFDPKEITKQIIDAYKAQSSDVFSASSMERHFSTLRKFFKFLMLEGLISLDPFQPLISDADSLEIDPWHIKDFKNFLYVYSASRLTIKNYLIDIKQFLAWSQTALNFNANAGNLDLGFVNSELVEEYKQKLLTQGNFSPATINRKLSSLRKYLSWAQSEGLISSLGLKVKNAELEKPAALYIPEVTTTTEAINHEAPVFVYSSFPPLRLAQKTSKAFSFALDSLMINPLAQIVEKAEYGLWKAKGQPVFTRVKSIRLPKTLTAVNILNIKNLPKVSYAPSEISTKYFPLPKKVWFALRYSRPKWYKTYHSYPITHYFHFAILIIFLMALSFGFYNAFFQKGNQSPILAAGPTAPPRILSFQGRLTDNNDNPITSATALRFAIYDNSTATGSALLWQEIDSITPDQDGIFNTLLGGNTPIPPDLFANNSALWLGVTVESTDELTPRQPLATVAFATNSEFLQGLAPTTQAGLTSYTNTVLALDGTAASPTLTIGGTVGTTFQATGGQFTLSGKTLLLTTAAGTNTNIVLTPDGLGQIDLQTPLQNSTNNNNIGIATGAVEVDDMFAILATSSAGQPALTINQNGSGPLFVASTSGIAKFIVDNTGNLFAAGNATFSGNLSAAGNGNFTGNLTTNGNLTAGGNLNLSNSTATTAFGGIAYTWPASIAQNGYILSTQTNGTLNWIAANTTSSNFWQEINGALSPVQLTDDLLLGGATTSSAKFAFTGFASGQTQASISGNLIVMPNNGYGGNASISGNLTLGIYGTGSIQTTSNQPLTIGGNTTGNINLSPLNGLGSVNIISDLSQGARSTPVLSISQADNGSNNSTGPLLSLVNNDLGSNSVANLVIQTLGNGTGIQFTETGGSGSGGSRISTNTPIGGTILNVIGFPSGSIITSTGSTFGGSDITSNFINVAPTFNFNTGINTFSGKYLNLARAETVSDAGTTLRITGDLVDLSSSCTVTAGACTDNSHLLSLTQSLASASGSVFFINNSGLGIGAQIVSNSGGQAAMMINDTGTGDLFTASYSGTTKFKIDSSGALTAAAYTTNGGLLYTSGTGLITQLTSQGTAGTDCLVSNGTGVIPSFSSCAGATANSIYWTQNLGALYPKNSTVDLLVGGQSTASAAFAVLGLSLPNHQTTASVSGNLVVMPNNGYGGNASISGNLTLGAFGASYIQTTKNQLLTIGGNTTGDIQFKPGNSSSSLYLSSGGNVGIGTTNPGAKLSVVGAIESGATGTAGEMRIYEGPLGTNDYMDTLGVGDNSFLTDMAGTGAVGSWEVRDFNFYVNGGKVGIGTTAPLVALDVRGNSGTLSAASVSGQTSFAALVTNNNGVGDLFTASASGWTRFTVSNTGALTAAAYTTNGGLLYTNASGLLTQLTSQGTAGTDCLVSNGTGVIPSFSSCAGATANSIYWTQNLGALYPKNSTVDLLVGGQSTASAAFAVLGLSLPNHQTTASVSGNLVVMPNNGYGGNASISGNLTLGIYGTGSIQTTSNQPLTIGGNTTGDIQFKPGNSASSLYLSAGGNVGIGTTNPSTLLQVSSDNVTSVGALNVGTGANNSTLISANSRAYFGYNSTGYAVVQGVATKGIQFNVNNSTFGSGTAMTIDTTGNVGIGTTSPLATLDIRGTSGTLSVASVSGQTSFAALVTNNNGVGDLFTASASGWTRFRIDNSGALTSAAYTGQNAVLYGTQTTGVIAQATTAFSGLCLLSGASSPSWSSCSAAANNFWQRNQGALAPLYTSDDLLIGGNSTASADFAFTGLMGNQTQASFSGQFVLAPNVGYGGNASISGTLTLGSYGLTGALQTTNNQPLTIGGNTTGDIQFKPGNSSSSLYLSSGGNVGIGTTNPKNNLSISSTSNTMLGINMDTNAAEVGVYFSESSNIKGYVRVLSSSYGTAAWRNDLQIVSASGGDIWLMPGNSTANAVVLKDSTGYVGIGTTAPLVALDVRGNSGTLAVASFSGQTSFATLVANNNGVGDLFTASASGWTRFTVSNTGALTAAAYTTNGGLLYTSGTGLITQLTSQGTAGTDCLVSNGTGAVPSFSSCAGATANSIYWIQNLGALYPKNSTVDLLVGGQSTASAKFAVLNMNSGTPIATVAGNFIVMPYTNGANELGGRVGIGIANPVHALDVQGASGATILGVGDMLGGGTAPAIYLQADQTNGLATLNSRWNFPLTFAVNNAEKMRINTAGNVGIGTTTPQGTLHIASANGDELVVNQAATTNLITNSSFETNTTGWSAFHSTLTRDNTHAKFGSYALKVVTNYDQANEGTFNTTAMPATAGTTYTYSGWQWGAASMIMEFAWYNTSHVLIGSYIVSPAFSPTNAWTRYTFTATAPALTAEARVIWYTNTQASSTTFWLDGIQLEQSSTATPYADGSLGPGYYWTGAANNSTSVRTAGALFAYQTINSAGGIGAASRSNFPTLQIDQDGTGDIFTASASGTPIFTITNTGGLALGTNGLSVGTSSQCLVGGTTASWGTCGSGSGSSFWQELAGALSPVNINDDLLLGGSSTTSALFSFTGIGTGTTQASISGNLIVMPNLNSLGGSVGIGTTAPQALLNIASASDAAILLQSDTGMASNNKNSYIKLSKTTHGGTNIASIIGTIGNSGRSPEDFNAYTGTLANALFMGTYAGNYLQFGTNGAVAATFDTGGKFGINTNSPTAYLDVAGTASLGGVLKFRSGFGTIQTTADQNLILGGDTTGQITLKAFNGLTPSGITFTGYNTCVLKTDSSGNVTCGTNTTNFWQELTGALSPVQLGDDLLIGGSSTTSAKFAVLNMGSGTPVATVAGNFIVMPYTSGSNELGGNVGIGTTNPTGVLQITNNSGASQTTSSPLYIDNPKNTISMFIGHNESTSGYGVNDYAGDIRFNGAGVAWGDISYYPNSGATDYGQFRFSKNGSTVGATPNAKVGVGSLYSAGNVGIGTTTPRATLDVSGDASVSGSLYFNGPNGTPANIITLNGNDLNFSTSVGGDAGTVKMTLSNNGNFHAYNLIDMQDPTYYLDPAGTGATYSLNTAGAINIGSDTADSTGISIQTLGKVIVGAAGAGKLTATTLDPLYTIDGTRYATYAPSVVGVKEEVTGKATLTYDALNQAYSYTLGLNNQSVGSDVWLFSRVVDTDINLTEALLTPDSSAQVWYQKDPSTRSITFYASQPTSVSFRLTAPRFDHEQWPNLSDETTPGVTGLIAPPAQGNTLPGSSSSAQLGGSFNFTIAKLFDQNGNDTYALTDNFNNIVKITQSFSDLLVANIQAGLIQAQKITTNSLSIATENVTIGGQNLRDYIASVINDLGLKINDGNIISPIASIDELHTNFVSPVGNDANIGLKLENNKLSILNGNSATASAVSSFDNQGNASFSGQLSSNSLNTNDATVSGTLHAGRILADDIIGLHIQAATVSAQYITNVTNVYNSSASADSNFGLIVDQATIGSSSGIFNQQLVAGNYINISSFSGQFAYVDNLSAATAAFSQGLASYGPTSLSDTSIVGQLSINGSLILANNSVNVLGSDLNLQPLRQGGISLMGGLVYFDTDGNLKLSGNAEFAKNVTVKGTLAAGVISPLPGSDLKVNLGDNGSSLIIHGASNSAVLSVNPLGDLIASGAATIAKLNLSLIQPAFALSPTELIATGSAGTASITPYQTEVTIDNALVTDKSLIYITPVGTTFEQSLYLLRQTPNDIPNNIPGSFTVGISNLVPSAVKFNFLIVN